MSELDDESKYIDAWHNKPDWRRQFLEEARRDLSKTGSLGAVERVLRVLSRVLISSEVVELYRFLQSSFRPDFEWQNQFLGIFGSVSRNELPAPIVDLPKAEREARELREEAEIRVGNKRSEK